MKLTIDRSQGGYAREMLTKTDIDGTMLDKPFVLFTGPNGSGKSAIMRGIRATIGLGGERSGKVVPLPRDGGNPTIRDEHAMREIPVRFDRTDLGWKGQPSYLFDSREASAIGQKASFDDDISYHVSLIAGGGAKVSHGQFVSKTWWEALEWAGGLRDLADPWNQVRPGGAEARRREDALQGEPPSAERWLFLDEPETAIDTESLLVGLSVLLHAAEIGRLRVFCASHSLLFAAGLMNHPSIQTVDMGLAGRDRWMDTQKIALRVAADEEKVASIGQDVLARMRKSR